MAANSSTAIADVLTSMGEQAGSGMLDVSWNGPFGQPVDPVSRFVREEYVTGLRSDIGFRTNVGFVNGGADAITVHTVVLSSSGAQIGTADLTLPAYSQVQYPLTALVQDVDQYSIGSCTLQARSNGASTLFRLRLGR